MKLSDKILQFLQKENTWVTREAIYAKGKQHGIDWEQMKESLDVLENDPCIGKMTIDEKTHYRYYERTPEEIELWYRQLELFGLS